MFVGTKNKIDYGLYFFNDNLTESRSLTDEEVKNILEIQNSGKKIIFTSLYDYEVEEVEISESLKIESEIFQLENYLKETDWYVVRNMDTQVPVPGDVKQNRQNARERISFLRSTLNSLN